jgi:hypothetical protein
MRGSAVTRVAQGVHGAHDAGRCGLRVQRAGA